MIKQFGDVQDYKFHNFLDEEIDAGKVTAYEFKQILSTDELIASREFQKVIKQERNNAKESSFKVNPIVEKHRGLKSQEEREYQDKVEEEVERRISAIQDDAFKAGFNEGVNQGREEIFNEMRVVVDQKIENLSHMINEVLNTHTEIISKQRKEIYQLLKNLSKWIILRELENDGKYIERLLEKILLEMQVRQNLLIQVSSEDFSGMPEVLSHLQSRLGELKNVRVEIDSAVETKGIIIESENGIVNASIEEQFKNLDKLFEDVLVEEK